MGGFTISQTCKFLYAFGYIETILRLTYPDEIDFCKGCNRGSIYAQNEIWGPTGSFGQALFYTALAQVSEKAGHHVLKYARAVPFFRFVMVLLVGQGSLSDQQFGMQLVMHLVPFVLMCLSVDIWNKKQASSFAGNHGIADLFHSATTCRLHALTLFVMGTLKLAGLFSEDWKNDTVFPDEQGDYGRHLNVASFYGWGLVWVALSHVDPEAQRRVCQYDLFLQCFVVLAWLMPLRVPHVMATGGELYAQMDTLARVLIFVQTLSACYKSTWKRQVYWAVAAFNFFFGCAALFHTPEIAQQILDGSIYKSASQSMLHLYGLFFFLLTGVFVTLSDGNQSRYAQWEGKVNYIFAGLLAWGYQFNWEEQTNLAAVGNPALVWIAYNLYVAWDNHTHGLVRRVCNLFPNMFRRHIRRVADVSPVLSASPKRGKSPKMASMKKRGRSSTRK